MRNVSRFLRDQLVLAQHHVNDAAETRNPAVRRSSLEDTRELLDRMRAVLPVEDQVSVAAEGYRTRASLADPGSQHNIRTKETYPMTVDHLKHAAAAETVDRANAFEIGFARAAREAGLDEAQYQHMRKIAIAQLQKLSADMQNAAQPATNGILGKGADAPQQEKRENTSTKYRHNAASGNRK